MIVDVECTTDTAHKTFHNPHILKTFHHTSTTTQVVVSPASTHPMSFGWPVYDGTLTGEVVAPSEHVDVLPPGVRRVIAHRAMMVIGPDTRIVNLGVGMPEVGVAVSFS